MSARRAASPVTLALVALACATSPDTPPHEELVGCWYFEQDDGARALRLPWGIRLGERPLEGWPALSERTGARAAATLTPEGERDHPFGYWRALAGGDSLHIGYPAGGGLAVDLAVVRSGDAPWPALDGTARPVGDVLPVDEPASAREPVPVRLTFARCPEEG